jgi:hypothetical protein
MKWSIRTIITVAALIVAVTALVGCRPDEPVATENTSNDAALVPTLEQVTTAVSLDDADRAVVSKALEHWREATAQQTDERFGRREAGMDFIAEVAPSLDNKQLGNLVDVLGEYRAAYRKDMRRTYRAGRPGPGGRAERGPGDLKEKLASELGLSADQQAALEAIHAEMGETMRAKHDALRAGTITREQMHEAMQTMHDAQREKAAQVLSAEQMSKLDALMNAHRTKMMDQWKGHMDEHADARAEWMATVLGMSADQRTAFEAALKASVAERKAALDGARDRASRKGAFRGLSQQHETMMKTLEGILTPEQTERLEILRRLHPRMPHGE